MHLLPQTVLAGVQRDHLSLAIQEDGERQQIDSTANGQRIVRTLLLRIGADHDRPRQRLDVHEPLDGLRVLVQIDADHREPLIAVLAVDLNDVRDLVQAGVAPRPETDQYHFAAVLRPIERRSVQLDSGHFERLADQIQVFQPAVGHANRLGSQFGIRVALKGRRDLLVDLASQVVVVGHFEHHGDLAHFDQRPCPRPLGRHQGAQGFQQRTFAVRFARGRRLQLDIHARFQHADAFDHHRGVGSQFLVVAVPEGFADRAIRLDGRVASLCTQKGIRSLAEHHECFRRLPGHGRQTLQFLGQRRHVNLGPRSQLVDGQIEQHQPGQQGDLRVFMLLQGTAKGVQLLLDIRHAESAHHAQGIQLGAHRPEPRRLVFRQVP